MKKRILHPTDFSPVADAAFAEAVKTARRKRGGLILLHVLEGFLPFRKGETYAPQALGARTAAQMAVRKRLDRLLARAKKVGVPAIDVLVDGWPPEEITKLARRRRAHLIVMGTHGHTGIRKVLLGSVAERVVASAPCPVLTVRSASSTRAGPR